MVEDSSQFNKDFLKVYNGDSDIRYFIEADVQYPENISNLQNNLLFLPETMKIEKIEKLVADLHDK